MATTKIRGSTQIKDLSIEAAQLAADSVITAKILDANVTAPKLADDAVVEAKIADGAVTSAKIADGAIVNADINAAAAIATSKLAEGAEFLKRDGSVVLTADWDLSGGAFTIQVPDPVNAQDVATKSYVDGVSAGLDPKESVKALAASPITLSGEQTVDGVALVTGDRILVTAQASAEDNGIYVVDSGAWSRSADADGTPANEVSGGMHTFVEGGTVYGSTGWVLALEGDAVVGTTALNFVQFSGAGAYSGLNLGAGVGVFAQLNGQNLEFKSLKSSSSQITLSASATEIDLTLAADSITATELADNAVDTAAIQDDAVTAAKLATDSVTSDAIAADAVTASELADNAVDTAAIQDSAVTTAKIAADAVTASELADNAVDTAALQNLAVTEAKLAADAVTAAKLADNAVDTAAIQDSAVTAAKLADSSVTSAKIVDGTIVNADISPTAAIARDKLAAGTASVVLVNDGSGVLSESSITTTELEALDGYESAEGTIETRLDALETQAGGATNYVTREVPSGTKDGVNATFTLASAPVADQESVYLNGMLLLPGAGNDYTISGATLTMLSTSIPQSDDVLLVNYFK